MKFKVVEHSNREEWLKWRQNGVGSSDVPVIMGVSRYKTYEELLFEKAGLAVIEDQRNQYIKDRGNRIEESVRAFYGEVIGLEFKPLNCYSIKYPHRMASLDGIDTGYNLFIEIKLLSSQQESRFKEDTEGMMKWKVAKESGAIPVDYWPQIQHQLSVTGAEAAMFIGLKEIRRPGKKPDPITEDNLAIVSVLPDKKYIKEMNKKIDEFWEKVLQKRKENEYKD